MASDESKAKDVFFIILWIILLICVAWPVSMVLAPFWVILLPFEVVFDFGK
jgi:hypothetical protein